MSLVVLNSLNENPHHFYNTFSEPIVLPRNARVCCQGYSFVRKEISSADISGNMIVNDDNNTITWTLNDPSVANSMVLPLERCEIPPNAYYGDDLTALTVAINKSLREAEQVSTYKGGITVNPLNKKFQFAAVKRRPKAMGPGNWISTNGKATVEAIDSLPDVEMEYIVNQSPTTQLLAGEINNTNGAPGQPILNANVLGISTTDSQGNNQALFLSQAVGKVFFANSGGGTPGREITYSKWQILGIQTYVPAAPSPITSATIIQFDVVCLEQNLDIANPPYNGVPINWFTSEPLKLTFVNEAEKLVAHLRNTEAGTNFLNTEPLFNCDVVDNSGQNLGVSDCSGYLFHLDISGSGATSNEIEMEFGLTSNQFVNYGQDGISDANKDWGILQAKVVVGCRVDKAGNILLATTPIPKANVIQSNTTTTVYETTGKKVFDSSGNPRNIKIMFRPIVDESKYKIQMLIMEDAATSFTHLKFVEITDTNGNMPLYQNLPLYAVAKVSEAAFPLQPLKCSAIYHEDNEAGTGSPPNNWALGFGYQYLDGTQNEDSRWLNWVNDNANSKGILGFSKSSYTITPGTILSSDTSVVGEAKSNSSILVNLEGCPITSFVGSANMGQSAPVIAVANRFQRLGQNLEPQVYKDYPFENWIHLNNRNPMTITRLGIRLTDVELKNLDCFEKSSTVWLKFSNDDKQDDTFKLN